ncbi:hypothetical protein DNTS_032787 [Danionella cerebrum]|uniref:Lysosome membrane protein 2-like n=1 Tax=Danionella cerebrum TaxID=2873325 RepID=A0A553R4M0_9TELE|nr:hypothetical protein DNTS_032787 [Danionella translucida]TRY97132.1 hypothetical protein DNTS_032787 [Danionella translucida]
MKAENNRVLSVWDEDYRGIPALDICSRKDSNTHDPLFVSCSVCERPHLQGPERPFYRNSPSGGARMKISRLFSESLGPRVWELQTVGLPPPPEIRLYCEGLTEPRSHDLTFLMEPITTSVKQWSGMFSHTPRLHSSTPESPDVSTQLCLVKTPRGLHRSDSGECTVHVGTMRKSSCCMVSSGVAGGVLLLLGIALFASGVFQTIIHNKLKKSESDCERTDANAESLHTAQLVSVWDLRPPPDPPGLCIMMKEITLTEGSKVFGTWKNPPPPVFMEFFFFNVTNPEAFLKGEAKAKLVEMGPYTYREYRPKRNVSFVDNGSKVAAYTPKIFVFVREKSVGDPSVDLVTTVNIPAVAVMNRVKGAGFWVSSGLSIYMNSIGATMFMTHTIDELLWGFKDPLLSRLRTIKPDTDEYFGLMLHKNGSDDGEFVYHTGEHNYLDFGRIYTWKGEQMTSFWRTNQSNMINGTDGSAFHPFLTKEERLNVFTPDLCRKRSLNRSAAAQADLTDSLMETIHCFMISLDTKPINASSCDRPELLKFSDGDLSIHMRFEKEVEVKGIPAYRFTPPRAVLASAKNNPENEGFCLTPNKCLDDGVLDVSVCRQVRLTDPQHQSMCVIKHKGWKTLTSVPVKLEARFPWCAENRSAKASGHSRAELIVFIMKVRGAPVVVSFPHFHLGDKKYIQAMEGLSPVHEHHQTFLDLNPTMGVPVRAMKRAQINIHLERVTGFPMTRNLNSTIFPIVFLNESVVMDDVSAARVQKLLLIVTLVTHFPLILVGLGVVLLLVFVVLLIRFYQNKTQIKRFDFAEAFHCAANFTQPSAKQDTSYAPVSAKADDQDEKNGRYIGMTPVDKS